MSKQTIITYLSTLSLSKLERLYDYARNIIIPEKDLLTNVTMQQMVKKSLELADINFPEWTDRSDSDFGRFLVELIALFSEKDFYYINGFANETFISKCKVYSDLFVRAVEFGYSPVMYTSSKSSISLTFGIGSAISYNRGDVIIADDSGNTFTNLYPFTVPEVLVGTTSIVTTFAQGDVIKKEDIYNGYRIDISETNIDAESVVILMNGLPWTKVPNFGQSLADDLHFIVLPEMDGSISIYFGDNTYGKSPSVDTQVSLSYIRSRVYTDFIGSGSINSSLNTRPLSSFSVISTTVGYVGETLEQLRQNTLLFKNTYLTVNQTSSIVLFLNRQPSVKRSYANVIGTSVYFRVIPSDGSVASGLLLTELEALVNDVVTMGYTCYGIAAEYVEVGPISADIYYLQEADASYVSETAKNIISDYTNPLVSADFGKDFNRYDLLFQIRQKIESCTNVVFTVVQGGAPTDVVLTDLQIMKAVSTGSITINLIPE